MGVLPLYVWGEHAVGLGESSTALKGFQVVPGSYRKGYQDRDNRHIKIGERWLQEHVQDDPQRPAALRALARFRAALAKTEASPREQQRLATWVRLETAFLAAEADYLSIVGQPAVAGRKEE